MPSAPRPDKQLAKLAYKLLKTPKDQQQFRNNQPTEKQILAWSADSIVSK